MAERLGFTFVGERPDAVAARGEEGVDCTWAMTRDEWVRRVATADGVATETAGRRFGPRPARRGDIDEIVRLARQMYEELGAEPATAGGWPAWVADAARAVADRLGHDVMVFVVDDPDRTGRLVSCGAGTIWRAWPNPGREDPRVGYVQ